MIDSGLIELLDMSLRPEADPSRVVPFQAIAFDGITLKSVQERTQIELAPGSRADVLIRAPTTLGTYLLYKERPKLHLTALLLTGKAAAKVDLPEILAVVKVAGDPCKEGEKGCSSHLLPPGAPLPAPLPDITPSEVGPQVRSVRFLVKDNKFTINGRVFDPAVVNPEFLLTKGKAEEWLIENENDGVPHPFHIHVNAFQMVNADGSPGEWRDTIVLAPLQKLKVRMRYERFTGTFVVHCHNLVHEDRGMMQLVQIK
jgi:FtsP/CotA-like multicopper oxidase with cupredoxin domain